VHDVVVRKIFYQPCCASGRFVFENTAEMHEFGPNFSVHKCNTVRLDESHQLLTTFLVLTSPTRRIQNISLKTIAAAGAIQLVFGHSTAATTFQPRWISLLMKLILSGLFDNNSINIVETFQTN
jgi:hypothetical protein